MHERFAVVFGSGFEERFADAGGRVVETVYGPPSAPVHEFEIAGQAVLGLPRHGVRHDIPAHVVNYRANLAALETLGATSIIALNTVGVISSVARAGQLAIPDQVLDYTWGREHTFFVGGESGLRHVDFTQPFSGRLRRKLVAAAAAAKVDFHDGGVYAATQGPRLESAAEVDRLERDGADLVGMTAMPEAALARELDIDYVCLALIVNPAAGRGEKPIHEDVAQSTDRARAQAMEVLDVFFGAAGT